MSQLEEKVVNQLSDILQLWRVTYNVDEEKYIAKTNSNIVLNSEQLEWISQMGLSVFTNSQFENTLTVKFASCGGCSS